VRIGVIGTGHVGLVAAATFAHIGHDVVATDVDEEKIEKLSRGVAPFFEPGLDDLLRDNVAAGRLRFATDTAAAVDVDVVFVCVGTPAKASGEANLVALERAVREVARHARPGLVLVQKSTVPAGTAERVERAIRLQNGGARSDVEIVSNPEFLREGTAIDDSLRPDRILVGAESPRAFALMREVYRPLIDAGCTYLETDVKTAELAKHASNAFLAMKISFANALARICELSGADVVSVADIMGADPRIGRAFLDAGLGYGGFCFPKDLLAFDRLAEDLGYDFALLREVRRINDEAVDATFTKIGEGLWNIEEKNVALLGLAFKAGTDDVRFSPGLALARRLLDEGARVVGYDPQAAANAKEEVPGLELASDAYQAASGAHCLVVCADWPEFRELDLARLRAAMTFPFVVDGRNLFRPAEMAAAGFSYAPTGRPRPAVQLVDAYPGALEDGVEEDAQGEEPRAMGVAK
jgi:UDPglucose 6-dehydrogenase